MKETHYKLKHRVTALFAAAVMLCSMLPGAAFAEEPTPQPTEETAQMEQQTEPSETDNGQTDESSPDPGEDVTEATPEAAEEQPAEEEIHAAVVGAELYTDLPNAPIGSYIGSEGLPVATGETKIGISEWPESQLEETSGSYLTAAALDNDGLTMAAPLLDGADYAIVPIMAQVEYPADGSTLDLVLPDSVTLLDYYGAPAADAESLLHSEYSETYGYIGTPESYDVTFAWDNERNDVVMATSIAKVDGAASSQSFEVVRSKDANADFTEQQTLKFYNDREKAKVGVYKVDRETGKYLAGAVFNLYAADDIYSVDGKLLFAAGELVATSPETGADGYTYFDCDIPIRGEYYGSSIRKDATTNSGNYIVKELRAPLGYYVNEEPMKVTFTYDGQAIMVLDNTCANKPTEMWVSKRDLTNDEELPGATLAIKDTDGNTVTTWVSTDEPHRVTGLHFGESYTLTEIRAADGYALANDITFRLIQKSDEDGNHLEECEVYYLTTKNILFWKWDDWKLLDDATVIMQDDITKVQISKKDLTTNEELPGAELIITDEKGSEIDRWISTDAPHYMEKLPAGKYTLTEVTAPDGYAIAERMEFEVLPNGEVQTFEMFDDTIKVKISKVDITTNEELPGAELVIKDKDGTEIDRWISTNGPHYVEKMPAGDYTLTEITAPNGYKVAESIDFTVLPTGEMQTVVMKDAREDTPTPTPDNTPTPDHTPQPTPNTTPAPTPVPAAPTATPTPLLTIPKTGDNSLLGLLLAIAGISLVGLAILIYKSARSKELAPRTDEDNDTEE